MRLQIGTKLSSLGPFLALAAQSPAASLPHPRKGWGEDKPHLRGGIDCPNFCLFEGRKSGPHATPGANPGLRPLFKHRWKITTHLARHTCCLPSPQPSANHVSRGEADNARLLTTRFLRRGSVLFSFLPAMAYRQGQRPCENVLPGSAYKRQ